MNLTRKQQIKARTQIQKITSQLVGELKARGFIVHRTDAVHSASAYLKLDYGLANTIRISDHAGVGEVLDFRFNFLSTIREPHKTPLADNTMRHWYGWGHMGEMIKEIEQLRIMKMGWLGEEEYRFIMDKNKYFADRDAKGFWKKARLM